MSCRGENDIAGIGRVFNDVGCPRCKAARGVIHANTGQSIQREVVRVKDGDLKGLSTANSCSGCSADANAISGRQSVCQ